MTAITHTVFQRSMWRTVAVFTLAFWLSSSLILDFVIMPSLFVAGMMTAPDFAAAGYSIFWIFNRIELVCAAVALTGILVLQNTEVVPSPRRQWTVLLGLSLLGVAMILTYGLTPEMSALGLNLNWFESHTAVPALMNQMHEGYWLLELSKLAIGGVLLNWLYRRNSTAEI